MSNEFEENGFIILRNVIGEEELEKLRSLQEEIVSYSEKKFEDPFLPWSLKHRSDQGVLFDVFQRHPEFQRLATNEKILDSLESVLGPNIYLYDNSLIYKPTGKRNGVPWHQDFISRTTEPLKVIAWIALDETTKENGTLRVIPGSHKGGFLPWHRVKGETHHDRANLENVDESKAIYAELKPGDVLLFHMLVLHGSEEAHSEKPRRVFRCSYQSMEQAIFTPRQSPIVVRGGSPKFLEGKYNQPEINRERSLLTRAINKAGRILASHGN